MAVIENARIVVTSDAQGHVRVELGSFGMIVLHNRHEAAQLGGRVLDVVEQARPGQSVTIEIQGRPVAFRRLDQARHFGESLIRIGE